MASAQVGVKQSKKGVLNGTIRDNGLHSRTLPRTLYKKTTIWNAIAVLCDNAYDPDVAATNLKIDKKIINNLSCLMFLDNGNGMNEETLHKMLSFGYCEKVQVDNHKPIGYYGNGFKSGSMRLGRDAIVFTRQKGSMSVGFLSRSYLEAVNADEVLVPIVTWSLPNRKLVSLHSEKNMKAVLDYSPFSTEEELLNQFDCIGRSGGTNIIIYNLKEDDTGRFELDFDSDPLDIRNPETAMIDIAEIDRPVTDSPPEYRLSLRNYCSILFLKPRMKISIRGKKVKTQLVHKSLLNTEIYTYTPKGTNKPIRITVGFTSSKDPEAYGVLMYNKNRLIKAYEKVGYQKQANALGLGVVGIVHEADILKPIHNKQDFERTEKYHAFLANLGVKLNDYWDEKREGGRTPENEPDAKQNWVQCDHCFKWRHLLAGIDAVSLPEEWYCYMNKDVAFNRCEIPEEYEDEEEEIKQAAKRRKVKRQLSNKSNGLKEPKATTDNKEYFPRSSTSDLQSIEANRKRRQPTTSDINAKKTREGTDTKGQCATFSTGLTFDSEGFYPDTSICKYGTAVKETGKTAEFEESEKTKQERRTRDLKKHKETESEIKITKDEVKATRKELNEVRVKETMEFKGIREDLEKTRKDLKELRVIRTRELKELEETRSELQKLKGIRTQEYNQKLIEEFQRTKNKLKDLRERRVGELKELETRTTELQKQTAEVEKTKNELRELRRERTEDLKQREELVQQLKDTQAELQAKKKELTELGERKTKELKDTHRDLENEKKKLKEVEERSTMALLIRTAEVDKTKQELRELQERRTEELNEQKETLKELKDTQTELQAKKKEFKELGEENKLKLKTTREDLERTRKELEEVRGRQTGEIKELEGTLGKLKNTQKELEATRKDLNELKKNAIELKDIRKELQKTKGELEDHKKIRTRESKESDGARLEVRDLQKEVETTMTELKLKKDELEMTWKELTEIRESNIKESQKARQEWEKIETELKEIRRRRTGEIKKDEETFKKLIQTQEELRVTRKELDELKEGHRRALKATQEELEKARKEVHELRGINTNREWARQVFITSQRK